MCNLVNFLKTEWKKKKNVSQFPMEMSFFSSFLQALWSYWVHWWCFCWFLSWWWWCGFQRQLTGQELLWVLPVCYNMLRHVLKTRHAMSFQPHGSNDVFNMSCQHVRHVFDMSCWHVIWSLSKTRRHMTHPTQTTILVLSSASPIHLEQHKNFPMSRLFSINTCTIFHVCVDVFWLWCLTQNILFLD